MCFLFYGLVNWYRLLCPEVIAPQAGGGGGGGGGGGHAHACRQQTILQFGLDTFTREIQGDIVDRKQHFTLTLALFLRFSHCAVLMTCSVQKQRREGLGPTLH